MKKQTHLLFAFLLIYQLGVSQLMFCPPGATWNYAEKGVVAGIDGIMEFKYTNDVVVNGISCKTIQGNFNGIRIGYTGNGNAIIPNVVNYKIYESNKVVYLYNGTSFDTVVNFNAAIGDKWRELYRSQSSRCSNKRGYFSVIDTNHITINNLSLKRIQAAYYQIPINTPTAAVLTYTTYFIERILNQGSIFNAYGDLFSYYCAYNTVSENPSFNFLCYHDDAFPTYQSTTRNCDDLTGVSQSHFQRYGLYVYPNPTNDMLTLTFESSYNAANCKFRIIDVLGHEKYSYDCGPDLLKINSIDLSSLPKGLYFLQVWQEAKLLATEKVLKD